MTFVDMNALQESNPRLHRTVVKQLGVPGKGKQDLNLTALSQFTRGEIFGWLNEYEFRKKAVAPDIAAAAVQQPAEPQIDFAETLRENDRDVQRRADEAAARNRLAQYMTEQGLEDTEANADAIRQWLDQNVKGYLSEQGIDLAIQWLGPRSKNVLTWKKAAPVVVVEEPAEPTEVLESWQLPLDADEHVMKRADVRAVKDLLHRRRAQMSKYIRPSGSFSSNIF